MRFNYSYVDTLRGGREGDVSFTTRISQEEVEAKVDRMIDPVLGMIPREGDPKKAYPDSVVDNEELRLKYERGIIELGWPIAPLYLLPEGSLLREEWFRRAEILKAERARKLELEAQGYVFGDE